VSVAPDLGMGSRGWGDKGTRGQGDKGTRGWGEINNS